MPDLQLIDITTDSHLTHAGKFRATQIVGHESCGLNQICLVTFAWQNCSLEQKLISVWFIVFDNFFKVAFVIACLLLWNTNDISQIIIKNFITYAKHRHIHYLTGTLTSGFLIRQKTKWLLEHLAISPSRSKKAKAH